VPAKAKPSKTTPTLTPDPAPGQPSKYARYVALGILVAAVAGTFALLVGKGTKSSPATTQVTVTPIGPTVVSASALKILARDLGQAIYWAGPVAGDRYELTRSTTNDVYVRYLPPGVKAGAHQGKYPLIATYPLAGALASLLGGDNGQILTVAGGKGGIAAVERGKPTNLRVAFPNVDFQIEVYDPSAREARKWATSAALTRVP
jgi:hypothetical protein